MASEKSETHLFSPTDTYVLREAEHDNPELPPRYAVNNADHQVAPGQNATVLSSTNTSNSNIFQMVFGPADKYVIISSLTDWRACNFGESECLLARNALRCQTVFCFAMSEFGDQLALYYSKDDHVPGWQWYDTSSSVRYRLLETWLNDILFDDPQNFKNTRVVFGPGGSYYAACGQRAIWHDLPAQLVRALETYRVIWHKAQAIKAGRDANPERQHTVDYDSLDVTSQSALLFGQFDFDALQTSWLPLHIALGPGGSYVAVWRETVAIALQTTHEIDKMLMDRPWNWTAVKSLSLSPHNTAHYSIVMNDWWHRWDHPVGGLSPEYSLKVHVQAWVKLQPERKVVWKKLSLKRWQVIRREVLDQTTNFEYHSSSENVIQQPEEQLKATEQSKKGQEHVVEKRSKLGLLAWLFAKKDCCAKS